MLSETQALVYWFTFTPRGGDHMQAWIGVILVLVVFEIPPNRNHDDATGDDGDRGQVGTKLEIVTTIIRKCNEKPETNENPDWNIGCKSIDAFDSNGFGGAKYRVTSF